VTEREEGDSVENIGGDIYGKNRQVLKIFNTIFRGFGGMVNIGGFAGSSGLDSRSSVDQQYMDFVDLFFQSNGHGQGCFR
jgi:hypothetical protein